MYFVMHRDRTIASNRGHAVEFKKGVPTYVPPIMRAEVLDAGAEPADPTVDAEEIRDPSKGKLPVAPTEPGERSSAILDVMEAIATRNTREDFTANGSPHIKALEAALGWKPDPKERDELWAKFQQGAD